MLEAKYPSLVIKVSPLKHDVTYIYGLQNINMYVLDSYTLLKPLFMRQHYWGPPSLHLLKSPFNLPSISIQSHLQSVSPPLSFQGQMQHLPFCPSLPLQSSCHLLCTNCTDAPAGFRCKSYLNLSPAATHTLGCEMGENRPAGYCCNLQNEHEFALWDIRAWTWATS